MTHSSPNELLIGVPVAKVATRSTTRCAGMPLASASSRRRWRNTVSLRARSSARCDALGHDNSSNVAGAAQVLVRVGLVDHQIVTAGFLKPQASVFGVGGYKFF